MCTNLSNIHLLVYPKLNYIHELSLKKFVNIYFTVIIAHTFIINIQMRETPVSTNNQNISNEKRFILNKYQVSSTILKYFDRDNLKMIMVIYTCIIYNVWFSKFPKNGIFNIPLFKK